MWIWGYFHAETPTGGLPTNFETIPSRFSSFFFRRTPVRFSYTTWLRILSLAFIPLSGLNLCESPALNKLRIIPGLWTIPGPRQSVGNMHWSRTQPAAGATEKYEFGELFGDDYNVGKVRPQTFISILALRIQYRFPSPDFVKNMFSSPDFVKNMFSSPESERTPPP